MISSELKMPQRPIVRNSCEEKVHSRVLHSKFSRIIRIDGHCIPETKQNWCWSLTGISIVSQHQVGQRIFLEADVFAMRKELYPLKDVETMADANTTCLNSYFKIVSAVIFGLSSMIDLFVVELGMPGKHSINNGIVFFQWAKQVLLLHEVQTNSLVPFQLANLLEKSFISLRREHFQTKEDKSHSKSWMLFRYLIINFVKSLSELALWMSFHEISLGIILIECWKKRPKLDALVAIVDILQQKMPDILFEDVKWEIDWEEISDLLLKAIPHLFLDVWEHQQFFTVQHCQTRHKSNKCILISMFLPLLFHRDPAFELSLFLRAHLKCLPIGRKIDDRVVDDI